MKDDLMTFLLQRIAEGAVGPSALRNQGAKGVITAARGFLKSLDLADFSATSQDRFLDILNSHTSGMQRHLPPRARHWGAARKVLNLFLRDVLYNRYLCDRFHFDRIEKWMEVPLDRLAAEGIRRDYKANSLPRWPGLKHLSPKVSADYQTAAFDLASSVQICRVHLDILYWRGLGQVTDLSNEPLHPTAEGGG